MDVVALEIRTAPVRSYSPSMEFSKEAIAYIGVLEGNDIYEAKACKTKEEILEHVEELKDLYGVGTQLIVREVPNTETVYVVKIKTDCCYESSPVVREDEKEYIEEVVKKLSNRFTGVQEEIILYFGRDEEGLYVKDLS